MKAICTSYNITDKGLVLRNNWTDAILDVEHLEEFLGKYITPREVKYQMGVIKFKLNQGVPFITNIIEGNMELENVAIHIRILKF